ncbi:MAG: DUF427 domain-containing protein [Pseudomonadota bacterium]
MAAFTIEPVHGTVVARADGMVVSETSAAVVLREGDYDPVYYFPRDDAGMEFLDRSAKVTNCPHKGQATHFDMSLASGTISNAAWSYETPVAGAEAIAGRIAFYPDKVTVEQMSD